MDVISSCNEMYDDECVLQGQFSNNDYGVDWNGSFINSIDPLIIDCDDLQYQVPDGDLQCDIKLLERNINLQDVVPSFGCNDNIYCDSQYQAPELLTNNELKHHDEPSSKSLESRYVDIHDDQQPYILSLQSFANPIDVNSQCQVPLFESNECYNDNNIYGDSQNEVPNISSSGYKLKNTKLEHDMPFYKSFEQQKDCIHCESQSRVLSCKSNLTTTDTKKKSTWKLEDYIVSMNRFEESDRNTNSSTLWTYAIISSLKDGRIKGDTMFKNSLVPVKEMKLPSSCNIKTMTVKEKIKLINSGIRSGSIAKVYSSETSLPPTRKSIGKFQKLRQSWGLDVKNIIKTTVYSPKSEVTIMFAVENIDHHTMKKVIGKNGKIINGNSDSHIQQSRIFRSNEIAEVFYINIINEGSCSNGKTIYVRFDEGKAIIGKCKTTFELRTRSTHQLSSMYTLIKSF